MTELLLETRLTEPLADGQHYFWSNQTEVLIYKKDSTLRAFSSICPHMGARLEVRGQSLSCPWHELDFSLESLKSTHQKYHRTCEYQVRIENGVLRVFK